MFNIESRPTRHTLPRPELQSLFGSSVSGSCSLISQTNNEICDGTSVLNDGFIPALSGVNDQGSQWADELFTMRRSGTDQLIVSFKVPRINHNRVELTIFNCPQLGIYAPQVMVYIDSELRIVRPDDSIFGILMVANMTLPNVNCEHLWKFCVQFSSGTNTPNFNLVFPYQNNSDSVFLGEVTFLNDPSINPQCSPPELITMQVTPEPSSTIG